MDNAIFDIYGDIDEFDTNEELKNAKKTIEDLQRQLNSCSTKVAQLEIGNKQLTKENQTLSNNLSSLLITARHENQRKDNEIITLRREKEDICFRRYRPVQKTHLSQFIQTDVSISATDLLNVQQLGNSLISEASNLRNAVTKQNDKLLKSTRAKTSFKSRNSFPSHRSRSRSRSRHRSRVHYESSKEPKGLYEPRLYTNRDRDRLATRERYRRLSEDRKHRHDERHIDSGHQRNTERDRYVVPSNQDRSNKWLVDKNQRYQEEDSINHAIKDARDIIKMKRARESPSNDRESKKQRSKSIDTSNELIEKLPKIFSEQSSSEIYDNQESLVVCDSSKHQCSNEPSESNHLVPTVSTVLPHGCAQRKIEIDSETQKPMYEPVIIPRTVPTINEDASTFEQATLLQTESQPPESLTVLMRIQNNSITDSLVEPLKFSSHNEHTNQLVEPKLNLKVSPKKSLKKILPKPIPSNKVDSEIESAVRAADFAEAILSDPRVLTSQYCTSKSESLKVITAFASSAHRTVPADITELSSEISLFPVPPTRSPSAQPSNPDRMEDIKKVSTLFTRDIPIIASGSDTQIVQAKVNNPLRVRGKSMHFDPFVDKQQNSCGSNRDQMKDIKKGSKIFAMEKRDTPVIVSGSDTKLAKDKVNIPIPARRKSMYSGQIPDDKKQNRLDFNTDRLKDIEKGSIILTTEKRGTPVVASGSDTKLVNVKVNNRMCARRNSVTISLPELKKCVASSRRATKRNLSMYKELPQPIKKNNYSENLSLIKSIIEDSNTTKYISASNQESLGKRRNVGTTTSSKTQTTTKLNKIRPITSLARIPKIEKQTSNETKHETATREETKTVKKNTILHSQSHESKSELVDENTNQDALKIPRTNHIPVKISNTTEAPADTKQPHKKSVHEFKDGVSPILVSVGTSFKKDQDASNKIVELLNSSNTTIPKPKEVANSCSVTVEITDKKDNMQFCVSNAVDKNSEDDSEKKESQKMHNTVDKNSDDKSANSKESQQMPKSRTLGLGKEVCISTSAHLPQKIVEMTETFDKTEESKVVSSTNEENQQTEIPIALQSSESITTHEEPAIYLTKRVSKHQSRKSSKHSKISLSSLPMDITTSPNSNMDIDTELELMHGMASETLSPYTLLTACVDNGSLIVAVDQRPKTLMEECNYQANEIANVTLAVVADVSPNEYTNVIATTKDEKSYSELTATAENSEYITETPRKHFAGRSRLKSMENMEKPFDSIAAADNKIEKESIQKSNDESFQSETSPLQTNRVLKSVGRVTYYVEQAQDGSNEETMYIVRKKKKKSKTKSLDLS